MLLCYIKLSKCCFLLIFLYIFMVSCYIMFIMYHVIYDINNIIVLLLCISNIKSIVIHHDIYLKIKIFSTSF